MATSAARMRALRERRRCGLPRPYLCDKAGVKTGTSKAPLRRRSQVVAVRLRRDETDKPAVVRLQSTASLSKESLLRRPACFGGYRTDHQMAR
jgi:hypothetical protein